MNIGLIIWLGEILDSITNVFRFMSIILCIMVMVCLVACLIKECHHETIPNLVKKILSRGSIVLGTIMVLQIIIPSSKVVYIYAAQEVATSIITNPAMADTFQKVQKTIMRKLDNYLEESELDNTKGSPNYRK